MGNSGSWCLLSCSWRLSSPELTKRNRCPTVGGKTGCREGMRSIQGDGEHVKMSGNIKRKGTEKIEAEKKNPEETDLG